MQWKWFTAGSAACKRFTVEHIYRAQCRHKCTAAHSISRGLYIRIQCHSGVPFSVVALFSVLHKWPCNCSTGNERIGVRRFFWWRRWSWWWGFLLVNSFSVSAGSSSSRLSHRAQASARHWRLVLVYLRGCLSRCSSEPPPPPRGTAVKWSIDCPCADGA